MLNSLLWIAQGLVAAVVTLTGTTKLLLPKEQLAKRMHWAATWPRGRIKLLGLAEVAGAVGLIAPLATGIAPVLTPLAASCLAVLMFGAVRTHQRLGEGFVPAVVIGFFCVAIAAGRLVAAAHGGAQL
jgi:DoxX-like family